MRWLVEVAPIDSSAASAPEAHASIVVEAESWQKALQAGRAARGEPGPISGFSIELLDEGYRAIDPHARKIYTVKRAAHDAVAEVVAAPSAPPPTQSPSAAPPPEPVPHAAAVPAVAPAPSGGPPRPGNSARPTAPAPRDADATIRMDSITDSSVEILSITDAPPSIAPSAPPPPPPHVVHHAPPLPPAQAVPDFDREPVPATQVIFKREHDPNDRIPLTYREYIYAVARGADEAAAERLLHHQLENVKRSIGRNKKGKFVNLAVFDVVFQGRPPVPPLATLAWKDWIGFPVIGFPRRPRASASASARAPAYASAPAPALAHSSAPPAGGYTAALQPVAVPAVTPPPSAPPPSFPLPAPTSIHTPFAAPPAEAAPAAMAIPMAAPEPAPAPVAASAPPPPPPPPPPPAAAASFPQATSGIDPFAPGTTALPAGVPIPAASSNPYTAMREPSISSHPPPMRAIMHTPTPSRPSLRSLASRRASGDELIASLFEAMHELHFARDVIEGGDYVLALVMEMIPSRAGIVHLYDIDRREYVVAAAAGTGTDTLLNRRHPETEPLLSAAMKKRRAIVIPDTATTEWSAVDRFLALGGAKTFIASPVNLQGRFLAVIEVINPLDGVAFSEKEGNAIDYISDQFAEFVATRGMLLDPERIAKRTVPQ